MVMVFECRLYYYYVKAPLSPGPVMTGINIIHFVQEIQHFCMV